MFLKLTHKWINIVNHLAFSTISSIICLNIQWFCRALPARQQNSTLLLQDIQSSSSLVEDAITFHFIFIVIPHSAKVYLLSSPFLSFLIIIIPLYRLFIVIVVWNCYWLTNTSNILADIDDTSIALRSLFGSQFAETYLMFFRQQSQIMIAFYSSSIQLSTELRKNHWFL